MRQPLATDLDDPVDRCCRYAMEILLPNRRKVGEQWTTLNGARVDDRATRNCRKISICDGSPLCARSMLQCRSSASGPERRFAAAQQVGNTISMSLLDGLFVFDPALKPPHELERVSICLGSKSLTLQRVRWRNPSCDSVY